MQYVYPDKLYLAIKKNWDRKRWKEEIVPKLPNNKIVQNMVDVVYHASFLTEENRRIWFRVIYINPKELEKSVDEEMKSMRSEQENSIRLTEPRDFNVNELLKLAPSADPTQVLIGVYKKSSKSNKLKIWGYVDAGTSWWNFIRHETSSGLAPPNGFTISSKEPGQITISRQGDVLLILKQGKLYEPSETIFYKGPVADFLNNGAEPQGVLNRFRSKEK